MKEADKEDYRVLATVSFGNTSIRNVLCKIFLPHNHSGPLQLQLFPTKSQALVFEKRTSFRLRAVIRDLVGNPRERIEAKDFCVKKFTRTWAQRTVENLILAEPTSLTIFQKLPQRKDPTVPRTAGAFWLTPSSLLGPPLLPEYHYTGEIKVRRGKGYRFRLNERLSIVPNYRYRYVKLDEGGVSTHPELVAEYVSDTGTGRTKKDWDASARECVDDFLLVCSFAARRRTVCVGWEHKDIAGWTRYYRRGISIPASTRKPSLNEVLIEPQHFKYFARQAYRRLRHLPTSQKDSIRQALHYVIPKEKHTVEMSYLSFCSVAETLVSSHNETSAAGIVLPVSDWNEVRADLKNFLKDHRHLQANRTARKLLYDKLPELNRVPFRTSMLRLCNQYSVSLDDLWPVTNNEDGVSLFSIRNKLIHGATFTQAQGFALIAAREHLRWTVERLLLGFFRWPVSNSTVCKEYLERNLTMYKDWQTDRHALST